MDYAVSCPVVMAVFLAGPVFPFGFEMGFFAVESEAAKLNDPGTDEANVLICFQTFFLFVSEIFFFIIIILPRDSVFATWKDYQLLFVMSSRPITTPGILYSSEPVLRLRRYVVLTVRLDILARRRRFALGLTFPIT